MTRKENEKDSERPHYYSQFWLDIAAGRRTIGGPKPEEEGELPDDTQEPLTLRRSPRSEPDEDLDDSSDFNEPVRGERPAALTRPVSDDVRPSFSDSEIEEPEIISEDEGFDDAIENNEVEDADIPDVTFASDEDEDEGEDEDLFDEDEDEDEDEGWVAGRGRKKPAPKRPIKPTTQKRPKRETRRGF